MFKQKRTFLIEIKWFKNDRGGDRRPITIDYKNESDYLLQQKKVLNHFKTKPMDINIQSDRNDIGKIPYSVKVVK